MKKHTKISPVILSAVICLFLTACSSEPEIIMDGEIAIEVAVPINEEQGEESKLEWVELAKMSNYPEFRMEVEDILGITAFGQGGKNGVIYVDEAGNHTNNSTLKYALNNQKFRDLLGDLDTWSKLENATVGVYTDIESDTELKMAFYNAYFGLFNDSEPNYFNAYSTLSRAEFLVGMHKAGNQVSQVVVSDELRAEVGDIDSIEFIQAELENSYLTLEDKSLNDLTATGTITRGEAIYSIVKAYYSEEFAAVGSSDKVTFTDAKNGGDIAREQKFIEKDKENDTEVVKEYWKSYELQYAINNPNKGMPAELYKALVVAEQVGLIESGSESRWDEGLTKIEAIEMIVRVFENKEAKINVDRGEAIGQEVLPAGKFSDIKSHITNEIVKDENGKVTQTVTITEELKQMILEEIPELKGYPAAFQEDAMIWAAKGVMFRDDTSIIIDSVKRIIRDYYIYGYDEKYGPGPAGTRPEDNKVSEGYAGKVEKPSTQGKTAISTPTYSHPAGYNFVATGKLHDGKMIYEYDHYWYIIYSDDTIESLGADPEWLAEQESMVHPGDIELSW